MSFLAGGGGKKVKPEYTGIQVQTSSSSQPITLLWGMNRISVNIIWYGDFKANKQKQKAGKGGASVTSYTYSASIELALCQGPIAGVARVFRDQDKTTDYTSLGFSLFLGTSGQAPWGYLTTAHPTEALSYSGIAYLAAANYDLGSSATTPQHSFETQGNRYNTGPLANGDADCALVVNDLIANTEYGLGSDCLDEDQLFSTPAYSTTGDSTYETYCGAMGFGLNPVLASQESAGSILDRWTMLTDTAVVWTGYSLKLIPYGTDTVSANGYVYVPNTTAAYYLTDNDFLSNAAEDPIRINRSNPEDANNSLSLILKNRDNEYNELPVSWKDQGLIDVYGLRTGNSIQASEICEVDIGQTIVDLIGQRQAYTRNEYEFSLPWTFCLLEPMDILYIYDPRLGEMAIYVQEIEEGDKAELRIVGKEIAPGVAKGGTGQSITNNPINTGDPAGAINAPIIFEPSASLTGGYAEVWAGVSGVSPAIWGGCYVYISTDGTSYQQIGQIDTPARQGVLTAGLPTYGGANPDNTNTLSVDLSMSGSDLQSVSTADAAAGETAAYVDGEVISYQTATLTGTHAYNLTSLYRKLFQTSVGAHLSGTSFLRLDENIFKYRLPTEYIGIPLYLKFQSYNIWGGGVQDLSLCTAYTRTPTGNGRNILPPTSVSLTFSQRTQPDGVTIIRGTVDITPSPGPLLDHHDVQVSTDGGTTWLDIPPITVGSTQTFFEPALVNTNYKARSRAMSSAVGGNPSNYLVTGTIASGNIDTAAPNVPTSFVATGSNFGNNLVWAAPSGGQPVRRYIIYGKSGHSGAIGACTILATVQSDTLSFFHGGLGASAAWRYFVLASNYFGDGTAAGPQDATTNP